MKIKNSLRKIYLSDSFKIYIVIFIYMFFTMSIFLRQHFVHDTYRIYGYGLSNTQFFLYQGRVITHIFFAFFNKIHINLYLLQLLSVFFSIVFLSFSALITYVLVRKRINIKPSFFQNTILIAIISGIFLNIYLIEWFIFFESIIMCLGCLFSILGCYFIVENKNRKGYIYGLIMFTLSVFCYQASSPIGGALLISIIIYDNRNSKFFDIIKFLAYGLITYGIAMLTNLLYVKWINKGANDYRASGDVDIIFNIKKALLNIKASVFESYGFLPKNYLVYIMIIVLLITVYYLFKKNKMHYLVYILISAASLYMFSVLPMLAMSSNLIYFMPRSIPYIGGIVCFIMILCILYIKREMLYNKLFLSAVFINFVVVTLLIINIQVYNLQNSTQDLFVAKIINETITKYEVLNNTQINTIVTVADSSVNISSKNIKHYSDTTARAFSSDWSTSAIMNYASNRNFKVYMGTKEDWEEIFDSTEYDDFDLDQIKIKDNKLYLLLY